MVTLFKKERERENRKKDDDYEKIRGEFQTAAKDFRGKVIEQNSSF